MLEYVGAWTIHQPPTLYMHLLMHICGIFLLFFFFTRETQQRKHLLGETDQI